MKKLILFLVTIFCCFTVTSCDDSNKEYTSFNEFSDLNEFENLDDFSIDDITVSNLEEYDIYLTNEDVVTVVEGRKTNVEQTQAMSILNEIYDDADWNGISYKPTILNKDYSLIYFDYDLSDKEVCVVYIELVNNEENASESIRSIKNKADKTEFNVVLPTKLEYFVNEELDLSGFSYTMTYTDTSQTITLVEGLDFYMDISVFDNATTGEYVIPINLFGSNRYYTTIIVYVIEDTTDYFAGVSVQDYKEIYSENKTAELVVRNENSYEDLTIEYYVGADLKDAQWTTTAPSLINVGKIENINVKLSRDDVADKIISGLSIEVLETTFTQNLAMNDVVKKYTASAVEPELSFQLPDGAKIEYRLANEEEYSETFPAIIELGIYEIDYKITKDNYEDYIGSYTITIEAGIISDTSLYIIQPQSYVFDDCEKTLSYDFTLDENQSILFKVGDGEYSSVLPSAINVSTLEITYQILTPNYQTIERSTTLKITAKPFENADDYKNLPIIIKYYTGDSVSSALALDLPTDATIYYKLVGGTYSTSEILFDDLTESTGVYIYYKITKDNYETIESYYSFYLFAGEYKDKDSLTLEDVTYYVDGTNSINPLDALQLPDGFSIVVRYGTGVTYYEYQKYYDEPIVEKVTYKITSDKYKEFEVSFILTVEYSVANLSFYCNLIPNVVDALFIEFKEDIAIKEGVYNYSYTQVTNDFDTITIYMNLDGHYEEYIYDIKSQTLKIDNEDVAYLLTDEFVIAEVTLDNSTLNMVIPKGKLSTEFVEFLSLYGEIYSTETDLLFDLDTDITSNIKLTLKLPDHTGFAYVGEYIISDQKDFVDGFFKFVTFKTDSTFNDDAIYMVKKIDDNKYIITIEEEEFTYYVDEDYMVCGDIYLIRKPDDAYVVTINYESGSTLKYVVTSNNKLSITLDDNENYYLNDLLYDLDTNITSDLELYSKITVENPFKTQQIFFNEQLSQKIIIDEDYVIFSDIYEQTPYSYTLSKENDNIYFLTLENQEYILFVVEAQIIMFNDFTYEMVQDFNSFNDMNFYSQDGSNLYFSNDEIIIDDNVYAKLFVYNSINSFIYIVLEDQIMICEFDGSNIIINETVYTLV